MTKIFFKGNGIISLNAISKEEDLKPTHRLCFNPPPEDGGCEVCRRHISELKPFGGPGDPLVGDFTGEFLVKTFRPLGPYNEEAEKAMEQAKREVPKSHDLSALRIWFIAKYGEEKGEQLLDAAYAYGLVTKSWECRDCIVLDDDEYFEKLRNRDEEFLNRTAKESADKGIGKTREGKENLVR